MAERERLKRKKKRIGWESKDKNTKMKEWKAKICYLRTSLTFHLVSAHIIAYYLR